MSLNAPVYAGIEDHPLISEAFTNLDDADQRDQQVVTAELLLGLKSPALSGTTGEELKLAIVRQINFQLEQSITPAIVKSQMSSIPGNSTTFRDRYVEPGAWAIVARVLGIKTVRLMPSAFGV